MQVSSAFTRANACFLLFYLAFSKNIRNFAGDIANCGMMFDLLLITLILVGLSMVLLSIRILAKRNGRFRSMHISDSKAMRDRGIGCVQSQDRAAQHAANKKLNVSEL